MVVLQNFRRSYRLFLPAKHRGASEFKLSDIKTTWLPLKFAKFSPIGAVDHGHNSVERYAVALVADAPHRHERSGHGGDLKD